MYETLEVAAFVVMILTFYCLSQNYNRTLAAKEHAYKDDVHPYRHVCIQKGKCNISKAILI